MSTLTEALDRIFDWIVKNNPELALSLQPGLTREKIEQTLRNLPFQLPEEFYELYQWRNGTREDCYICFLPGYTFLSLEQALEEYIGINQYREDLLEFHEPEEIWYKLWFPVFMLDAKEYLILFGSLEEKTSPVLRFVIADEPATRYPSLTNMMLAIAQCYEAGAYYLREDGYLEEDDQKADEIGLKYGSDRSAYEATLESLQAFFN